jgi:hypothetical protein
MENHRQEPSSRLDGGDHEELLLRSSIESDRKFWSGERPITVVQGIGLLLMFLALVGAIWNWPKGEASWWEKLVSGNGAFVAVFGCLVLFVLLGNRWSRRKTHPPNKH